MHVGTPDSMAGEKEEKGGRKGGVKRREEGNIGTCRRRRRREKAEEEGEGEGEGEREGEGEGARSGGGGGEQLRGNWSGRGEHIQ